MSVQPDPTVEDLRRESERSRAALTKTVVQLREQISDTTDELKERLSPANIKEEVKDYVREGSEQLFVSIERKARENPLQAVAIGAGIAYPLWGLIKSVPVPLMLIGAGLWLSQQKTGGAQSGQIAKTLASAGAEGADRVAASARSVGGAVAAGAETISDNVRATVQSIGDSASAMREAAVGSVTDAAAGASETVSTMASDATQKAGELMDKAVELSGRTRSAFEDLVERNPLLVGGVGLAIGAFIAASIPPSDAENRMFGERSEDVKNLALQTASQGVEHVKDLAEDLVGDVAAAAASQGLDAEGVAQAVQKVTEGTKSVVDKGLKTAFGEEDRPPSSSPSFAPASSSFESSKS